MAKLTVLITNNTLAARAGSELYVRDVATGLLERGYTPIAFSSVLGDVARDLRAATIPVIDNLESLGRAPDIIHGHHHLETMMALLRFPDTPAIYFCHGWLPWEEAAPRFPRIMKYVAVDDTCRDRVALENGIPANQISVLLNFVDLKRFKPRGPLPARPGRALIFSNSAKEDTHLPPVREACEQSGLDLDIIGVESGNQCNEPEKVLGNYDIVFAKARSALEAMAVGAAVVLCDANGSGPMVTSGELDRLRRLNFGIRALRAPVTAPGLMREIARYDAEDAVLVSARIRAEAGRDAVIDDLVLLYDEAIEGFRNLARDPAEEQRAASDYLRWLSPVLKERPPLLAERDRIRVERDRMASRIAHLEVSEQRSTELEQQLRQSEQVRGELEKQLAAATAQLGRINRTLGWRIVSWFGPVKHRFLIPAYKQLKKLLTGWKG